MNIAKFNIDSLIPVIIGLIWVVAQLAGAVAKKKKTQPRITDEEKSPTDPFAELMRKLSGVQEFKIPAPPEPEKRLAQALPTAPAPLKTQDEKKTQTMQKKVPASLVSIVNIQPPTSSFQSAMPSMKLPSMSFQSLPSLSGASAKKGGGLPSKLEKIINPSDKQTLRRAILGHIVLGNPRGMDEWNGGNR